MIVDDVIGSSEFDVAFRKEIKEIYPDKELTALPADHPLLTFVNDVTRVHLSPLAAQEAGTDVVPPRLEVIQVDGQIPVIYSPAEHERRDGKQLPRAYNKGYADEDALKLGVNVFMYAVSH